VPRQLAHALPETASAAVGVEGQQDERARLRGIRMVDARGGAHEAVTRLGDHERATLAHDAPRLAQDHLDLARIALLTRELDRLRGRFVVVDPDDAPLRLRDCLLREDDDVMILELDEADDERCEVVVPPDLRQARHRDDRDHPTPLTRMPACAL
jgi:hypothetical protein